MKSKPWPKSWKVPKDSAAIIFYADGSISAFLPRQDEYEPESAGMMAVISMIVVSEKMRPWRKRFIAKQFSELNKQKKP